MAKKKTDGPDSPAAPTPAATRRRTSSSSRKMTARPDPGVAEPGATPPATEPLDLAADRSVAAGSSDSAAARAPSHDDIAREAYQRYIDRGAEHGSDWDDWLEAERSLRSRR